LCEPEQVAGLSIQFGGVPVCAFDKSTFGPLMEVMERLLWSEGRVHSDGWDGGSSEPHEGETSECKVESRWASV
jgi:hypothetical protein